MTYVHKPVDCDCCRCWEDEGEQICMCACECHEDFILCRSCTTPLNPVNATTCQECSADQCEEEFEYLSNGWLASMCNQLSRFLGAGRIQDAQDTLDSLVTDMTNGKWSASLVRKEMEAKL